MDICPAVGHEVSQEMVALALYSLGCAVPAYGDAIIYRLFGLSAGTFPNVQVSVWHPSSVQSLEGFVCFCSLVPVQ